MTQQTIHNSALFDTVKIGDFEVPNRVFMAPLTRSRSIAPGHTQTPLHALYYAQRASAGLIITEATQISLQGQGYAWTAGLHTEEQAESWKPVTDAVHNAGGRIFVQLWHVGAISHNVFQPDGRAPVSSSVWTPAGGAFVGDYLPDGPRVPHPTARALTTEEIDGILEDYRRAARYARKAGFDGVELHAANGYLIDQFLRDSVNKRTDDYGGSLPNRLRLLNEAVDALTDILPPARVGVRLSPIGGAGASFDSDPKTTYTAAATTLAGRGLAYLHVARPNTQVPRPDMHINDKANEMKTLDGILRKMRGAFDGPFIANGELTPSEAASWISAGNADAVSFGRLFLANPDLPARIAADGPYNEIDRSTLYGGGYVGYTDYPTLVKVTDTL